MDAEVEFQILGTVCRVVADVEGGAEFPAEPDARPLADAMQVIGGCTIQGRRYLILSQTSQTPSPEASISQLLTQRELQVAIMVSEGEGNKQIADRLKLSEWTVSSYLRRIYAKLGVHTRAAMVAQVVARAARTSLAQRQAGLAAAVARR